MFLMFPEIRPIFGRHTCENCRNVSGRVQNRFTAGRRLTPIGPYGMDGF